MGTHSRLGSAQAAAPATAAGADTGKGCAHVSMLDDNLVTQDGGGQVCMVDREGVWRGSSAKRGGKCRIRGGE